MVTDQFLILLDQIPLQLDSEGINEREDGERCVCVCVCGGGGGGIIWGRRLIEGRLFEEIG